ncbi:MFS transporter [Neoroseomonas soli]|uniref:MFS transporter n=1 Tax=Neoroseomonas soli TaxID=1081025 RepID=A0A9X9X1Z2_9PROT|nr:MFS transporter [Neoroseomonas soli]MBR0673421.1 MFS transporter [Neoroseomonas soli]
MSAAAALMVALAAMTGLSQFHRAALGVVAPDLAADLALTPAVLGAANGMFFAALLVAQIPVGIALDRAGPRRTVAALAGLAVAGAGWQALATDGTTLLAARFVLGLGSAASFMAAVVLCARWHSGAAMTLALSRVFAVSQMGILLAGAPLAALAGLLGWRGALGGSALLTAACGVLWWRLVRDDPPDRPPPHREAETLKQALLGQVSIWRLPGLARVLSMHLVAYAAAATVIGLWAGPYLAEVHGLDAAGRGWALAAMGAAMPAGLLLLGPLERMAGSRRPIVTAGAALAVATLAALALWHGAPLGAALMLLVLLVLFSAYPVLVVAEGRSLFPDHLVGRGATTVNLAQVLGSALLPMLVGAVVGLFPEAGGVRPEAAYRAGFGVLGAALALGLAGWLLLPRGAAR